MNPLEEAGEGHSVMLDALTSLVRATTASWKQQDASGANRPTNEPTRKISAQSKLPLYTLREVTRHNHHNDCWLVINNKVYDVTTFLGKHPGGDEIIWENAGRDATIPFLESGHSKRAVASLEDYCIGILVEEERLYLNVDFSSSLSTVMANV